MRVHTKIIFCLENDLGLDLTSHRPASATQL